MRIIRDVLSVSLGASGLVGAQVLLTDKWLWAAAPSHAYGLVIFVVIDAILAGAVWSRRNLTIITAALIAFVQFGAMLADIVAGQPEGVPSVAFRNYLLNDTSYIALLAIQIIIMIIAMDAVAVPLIHRHRSWRPILPSHGP